MDAKPFQNHLEHNIIPFWNVMEDTENGGFYGYADSNGQPDKASHAYDFLASHFYDSRYGGVFWSVHADGTPDDTTKHTYNQAFAIYALAVYYQVSGKKEALTLAYSIYQIIENKCRDAEGYFEAFSRDFSPVSNKKLSENGVMADRTMNTLLHVLEAYTKLYRADEFFAVGDSIRNILRIFKFKVYDPENEICQVFFDKSYHSLIKPESYGHDIEASWLIDRACQVLKDDAYYSEMLPVIEQLADGAYKHGIDPENHAMNNECENGNINAKKVWWVQVEAVTGFFNAYQNQPERKEYLEMSEQVWKYIQNYVVDKKTGEWIEDISPDNNIKPNQALAHPWKCPYHNGRMCIEMINRLSNAS